MWVRYRLAHDGEEDHPGLLHPGLHGLALGQPVEGRVYLDRVEDLRVALQPASRGQSIGVEAAAPVTVAPARAADADRFHQRRQRGLGGLTSTPSSTRSATSPGITPHGDHAQPLPVWGCVNRGYGVCSRRHTEDGMANAVILDIDGTLVDTNYHHALAWHRALHAHGHSVPMWQVHRRIGMGGDKIVAALDRRGGRAGRRRRHPRRRGRRLRRADRRSRADGRRPRADRRPATRGRPWSSPAPPRRTRWTITWICSKPVTSSTAGRPRLTSSRPSPPPTSSMPPSPRPGRHGR